MKSKKSFKVFVSLVFMQILLISTGCAQEHRGKEKEDGTHLKKNQTHDVTKYGVRLVLKYNKKKQAFIGRVENKSREVARRTRVEIHLSNGTELGPTTPKNLKPGEKLEVVLSTKGQDFKTWSAHAEVGSREHNGKGERGEGHRGREKGEHSGKKENRGEGHEGGEKGEHNGKKEKREGHYEGKGNENTPNDGAYSRDNNRSPITSIYDSYRGTILGLEVNVSYDSKKKALIGTVKNVSNKKLRYIQNEPHLTLGKKTVGELGPQKLGHLRPGQKTKTAIYLEKDPKFKNVRFDGYFIHIEVGTTGYPTHESGEKSGHREGKGHEGKGERGEHGGKKEGKGEH